MNNPNRDLLILLNQEMMSPQAMQHEVEMLHEMLYRVERLENLVTAHEILNLNKARVINQRNDLRHVIRQRRLKPFVFLNCKN